MDILDAIKTVRSAVATKDIVPVLTHYFIDGGTITASNGRMSITAQCDSTLQHVIVPAEPFLRAVDACCGDMVLSKGAQRLTVKDGRFKATLPLLHEPFPAIPLPQKLSTDIGMGLLYNALRNLAPFVGQDATRPWANGILLSNGSAFATNNVTLASMPVTWEFDPVIIPAHAVAEVVRMGVPKYVTVDPDRAIAFMYESHWLVAALIDGVWPDVASMITEVAPGMLQADRIAQAVHTVAAFCDANKQPFIQLHGQVVGTVPDIDCAQCAVPGVDLPHCAFNAAMLSLVLTKATGINLNTAPNPCYFSNSDNGLEGVIAGARV